MYSYVNGINHYYHNMQGDSHGHHQHLLVSKKRLKHQLKNKKTSLNKDDPFLSIKDQLHLREGFKKKIVEFSTKSGGEGVRIGQFSTKKNIG